MTITLDGTTGITTPGLTNTGTETIAALSVSGAVTLSGGTANGVAYLNGSKVLTTGSALTYNGTGLGVQKDTNGTVNSLLVLRNDGTGFSGVGINFNQFSGTNGYIQNQYTSSGWATDLYGYDIVRFFTGATATEQMRLTSTGLGIGTSSPDQKLAVNGNAKLFNYGKLQLANGVNTTKWSIWDESVTGNDNLQFDSSSVTGALVLTQSGNLGIGTSSPGARVSLETSSGTPLNYIDTTANTFSSTTGIRIGSSNTANASIPSGLALWNNVYSVGAYSPVISFSSRSSNSVYNNAYAGMYGILGGEGADANWVTGHIAFATSSSAGLTERMRLDSSGNLLLGTTTNSGTLTVKGNQYNASSIRVLANGNVTLDVLNASGTEVGYIQVNGAGTGTVYATSSDQRLKENIADAVDAGAFIDAIQVRQFDWISSGTHEDYGLIAQELMLVRPDAVSHGQTEDSMKAVDYPKLVPLLVKEIQSLRVRLNALESK